MARRERRPEMVTRGNLDDRLATVLKMLEAHTAFDDERWAAHKAVHEQVAESLREYKSEANEWRETLADLRSTFIPKAEYQAEHRALDAKLSSAVDHVASKTETLDSRLDVIAGEVKDIRVEQTARRSVFNDSRSIIASVALLLGAIATGLLLIDRLVR